MVPQLVTQLDLDAPLVVVVGAPSTLRSLLSNAISDLGLQVSVYSEEKLLLSQDEAFLEQAYKIIWIFEPLAYQSKYVQALKQQISEYSRKTIVVTPLLTGCAEPTIDTSFSQTWHAVSRLQEEAILNINTDFSDALFIFAENIPHRGVSPLEYLMLHLEKGTVYDPDCDLSLLSLESFVTEAVPFFFRPSLQQSIVFSGEIKSSTVMADEVVRLQAAYFSKKLFKRTESLSPQSSIPFLVQEKTIHTPSLETSINAFTRSFRGVSRLVPLSEVVEQYPSPLEKMTVTSSTGNQQPAPNQSSLPSFSQPTTLNTESPHLSPREEVLAGSQSQEFEPNTQQVSAQEATNQSETIQNPRIEKVDPREKVETEPFDVNTELSKIFQVPRTAEKVSRVQNMAKSEIEFTQKSKNKKVLFYGGLGFIGLGIGVICLFLLFLGTQFFVKRQLFALARDAVQQNTIDPESWTELETSTSFLQVQAKTYGSFLDLAVVSDAEHIVDVSSQLTTMSGFLKSLETDVEQLYGVLAGTEVGTTETISLLATDMASRAETAYQNLSLVRAGIEQIPFSGDSDEKEAILTAYQDKIDELRTALSLQRQVLPLLPELFGGTKKSYLVLFQNEQELRPTGGFIQAAALLTFSEGQLISTEVFSSYDIDEMVAGTVAPPDDLTRFLGEQKWYFRDSNWNPDFTQSAAKASWYVERATGSSVDGVMALTLESTAQIIEALGPLELPEHDEVVTNKNLAALMEHHSEKLLVKGTTSKAYSVLLLERLLERMTTLQPDKTPDLLEAVADSFEKKQLLISVTNDTAQEVFSTLGWTGVLVKPECPVLFASEVCTVDAVAQVAANTGVNKANYYLDESVSHVVELLPGTAQHTRTIRIENTADINSWPKGDYRAYYRFYVAASAQIDEVRVNNKKIGADSLVERIEQGRTMVGFLVTVPIQAQTEVVLKYSVPLAGDAAYAYAFFDQKQPGTTIPTTVTIVPYSGLKPAKIAPQAEVTPSGIVFDTENRQSHGFYGVEFR